MNEHSPLRKLLRKKNKCMWMQLKVNQIKMLKIMIEAIANYLNEDLTSVKTKSEISNLSFN